MKRATSLPSLIANSGLISEEGVKIRFDSKLSSFDMDAQHLAMFTDEQMVDSKEKLESSLNELIALDQDQLHNAPYTQAYRELADKLAQDLAVDIANLKETQKEVDQMMLRYNFFRSSGIKADPVLDKAVSQKDDLALSIEKYDWQSLEGIDEYVVRNDIHGKLGKDITENLSNEDWANLLNQLPFAHKFNAVEFHALNLSDEAYGRVFTAIRQNTTLDDNQIAMVLNTICNYDETFSKAANSFCRDLIFKDSSKLRKALSMVHTWSRAIPVLSSQELLDVSNSTMSAIMERVNVINSIVDVLTYTCIDYRRNRWEKALLVAGPAINADNLPEFEKAGGKLNDVVKYNNYFYKDIVVPNNGVSAETLFNGIKSVESKIDEEIANKKIAIDAQIKQIEFDSFCAAGSEWINNNRQFFNSMDSRDCAKLLRMIGNTDKSIEDKAYNLILNSKFAGTSTIHLFNMLSKGYSEHIAQHQNLSAEDAAAIDTRVYSRIISDRLLESGLLK